MLRLSITVLYNCKLFQNALYGVPFLNAGKKTQANLDHSTEFKNPFHSINATFASSACIDFISTE